MLASQLDNEIPDHPEWITRQLGLRREITLKPLIDKGFLIRDSKALASCKQSAIGETETETETETEKSAPARKTNSIPDWYLNKMRNAFRLAGERLAGHHDITEEVLRHQVQICCRGDQFGRLGEMLSGIFTRSSHEATDHHHSRSRSQTPPPSLNVLLRMHWRERKRLQHRIRQEVWAQVNGDAWMILPNPHRQVKLTGIRYGKKALDPDNLIGSLKPVIDALVHSLLLIDDTEQYLAIGKIRQEKLKKGEVARLEITIDWRKTDED